MSLSLSLEPTPNAEYSGPIRFVRSSPSCLDAERAVHDFASARQPQRGDLPSLPDLEDFLMPADRSSFVSRRSFLRIAAAAAAVPIMTEAHFAWAYSTGAQSLSLIHI